MRSIILRGRTQPKKQEMIRCCRKKYPLYIRRGAIGCESRLQKVYRSRLASGIWAEGRHHYAKNRSKSAACIWNSEICSWKTKPEPVRYVWNDTYLGPDIQCLRKNDNDGTMLSYAMHQFFTGQPAKFSSATQMWDYLYEDDAGKMFYLLGEHIEDNKVYCIANGSYQPLKTFILEMKEVFGPDAECEFAPGEPSNGGLQPDTSDLVHDISYRPIVTFKEGIQKMIAHKRACE